MRFPQARPFRSAGAGGSATPQGQFVIRAPFAPFGPRPRQADNLAFMAEIDVIRYAVPDEAQRIIDGYLGLGGNHVMTGPAWANGYHWQYPNTDWLSKPAEFVKVWKWLSSQVPFISYVVAPDNGPFYDERTRTFDWREMDRLAGFYRSIAGDVEFSRVVSQWEQFQFKAEARKLFQWMRELFPKAERIWHNPPGHLSPGDGTEEERATWESAAQAGINAFYMQAHPPTDWQGQNRDGRTTKQQMQYDLADMVRRMRGINSPWGGPILNEFGKPIRVVFNEGTAYSIYNAGVDPGIGAEWCKAALAVEGVTECHDGLPE